MLALVLRIWLRCYLGIVALAARRPPRPVRLPAQILLTGTFHSSNWIVAHARPIVESEACGRLTIVSSHPPLDLPGLEWVTPPKPMRRICGEALSRLIVFGWLALRRRPDFVGGFHLLFNGLAAILIAKLIRRRALYFSVGGPAEVERGGLWSENKVFQRLPEADYRIESMLLRAIGYADFVITMGSSAATFFRARAHHKHVFVHGGGMALDRFQTDRTRDIDILFVGRLAPIKRLDLMLEAVAVARRSVPGVRAAIVGDGPLRTDLESHADRLGLSQNVLFAGFQSDVAAWLARAKLLIMTSDSEGLSLALIEAMASGVAGIVRDVGDLGDLVADGVNGRLIAGDSAEDFGTALAELLNSPQRLAAYSAAARQSAAAFDLSIAAQKWTTMFSSLAPLPDRSPE